MSHNVTLRQYVTLHVSVWVEISVYPVKVNARTSRSTWACELKWKICTQSFKTLRSRSTWACELKWSTGLAGDSHKSHAPRERVSWNPVWAITWHCVSTSRSTWAFELKFPYTPLKSTPVRHAPRERVSWNGKSARNPLKPCGHAPRERVSWNEAQGLQAIATRVTLHVSVWVEIGYRLWPLARFGSRSTWACELK